MSADPSEQRPRPVKDATPLRSTRGGGEGVDGIYVNGSTSHPGPGQLMLDLDFVRGLISAVDESGIDSLEIIRAGTRIRISKSPATVTMPVPHGPQAGSAAEGTSSAHAAADTAAVTLPVAGESPSPKTNLVEITSPMVGTFYRAPAPEAPAYVEVGSHVSKGQTLCILEAMKLMNELESDVEGIVREVLAENADPVEYGQVLFRIEPSGAGE